jgi:hypothetical protein
VLRAISSALAQHIACEATRLATCWPFTRRDGVVQGSPTTSTRSRRRYVIHRAASGYTRTAIRNTADLAVDNLERVFSADGITKEGLQTA